jgi:segregation and condensation protein A
MESEAYNVQTEFFEGPLDLLLHLIRKKKMDILDVKISEITSEYLDYLESDRGINLAREGEFLTTAATLIYMKSRTLLPRPESILTEDDAVEKRFFDSLIEYEKIQKISKLLKELENEEIVFWRRQEITEEFRNIEFDLKDVSSFQLAEVFYGLIKKKEQEDFLLIESKEYSIEAKVEEILGIVQEKNFLDFNQYISSLENIGEILVSFFSLLEMVKQKLVIAVQKKLFDPISIWKTSEVTEQ